MKIDEQIENIVKLWDIRTEKSAASSPFGPVNPASTTLRVQEIYRANQEARLTELLSSLEKEVESLQYKSFTAYDMLASAIEDLRVVLLPFTTDTGGTDEESV